MTEAQKELYEKTKYRLRRLGAENPADVIVALAEEIEGYRKKIQSIEKYINSRSPHKQCEGEWISVNERLPKHLEKVVAIDTWGDMFTAVYIMFVNEKSTWSTPYSHGGKVTHWMPLPEAPKMKGGAE
jgi:hypothetical protein